MVIAVEPGELADMPEELFAVKISQSKKPERAGKLVFSYLAFRLNESTPWSDLASNNHTIATPLSEIKAAVVSVIGSQPNAKVQFTMNMPGKFANIMTSDGNYSIYDFNETPDGNLGYYLRGGSVVTVELTPSEHQGNSYYRMKLSAKDTSPEDLFVRGGKGKIFGQEDSAPTSVFSGDATGDQTETAELW